ncbi:MAG: carbohydrate-binding protein [Peptococcaceae bacterium]|nr:carbohydrate-binding protein [Peptococcaceae bacterium]
MFVAQGKTHLDQRVDVIPSPSLKGRSTTIKYDGLLKQAGADRLFMHYGFDGWKNPQTTEMKREPDGTFSCSVVMNGTSECNFCFKDSANNWDNNNGWNWATDIRL